MAKKQKHPEHENLERWLVSYADFITLLFATFVVLYALSQVDLSEFVKLEESMKNAFNAPSLVDGSESIMPDSGESLLDTSSADSFVAPLMLEYVSQKYEEQSFESISQTIKDMTKSGELEGVESKITDKGLLITFKDDLLFLSSSATLTNNAMKSLDKVGALISEKFALHLIRIEGHTDSDPIASSYIYPSNWELSSARSSSIIRYMIERFKFMPSLFTAVGYADTRPIADNKTKAGKDKNRRVEILILKNQFKSFENPITPSIMKHSKKEQEAFQKQRFDTIKRVRNLSDAANNLSGSDAQTKNEVILLDEPVTSRSQLIKPKKEEKTLSIKNKTLYEQLNQVHDDNWLKEPPSADFEKELNKHFDTIGQ